LPTSVAAGIVGAGLTTIAGAAGAGAGAAFCSSAARCALSSATCA